MLRRNQELTVFILLFSIYIYGSNENAKKIDTTIVTYIDLTGDKKNDSIFCHITGESWEKPFTIDYKIIANKTTVYSKKFSDESIDRNFSNPNATDWCEGYIPCKRKWYFAKMHKELIEVFKVGNKRREKFFDTTASMSLASSVKKFYIYSLKYSRNKANNEITKLISFLRDRDIVFIKIPVDPFYGSYPKFYDPIQKKMIQLYGY